MFKSTSKLTSASLAYVFQDLLTEQDIPITVEVTDTDRLTFTCDEPFQINRMSYNAKLVTGFYYVRTEDYPLLSKPFDTQTDINSERKNVDIKKKQFHRYSLKWSRNSYSRRSNSDSLYNR